MREFERKRKTKKALYSRYVIALLFIVCILVVRGTYGAYGKYERARELHDVSMVKLADLEKRKAFLESELERFSLSDGKEREIRDRFGFVKEDEKLIILPAEEFVE
jgi:cell division protein FtsB